MIMHSLNKIFLFLYVIELLQVSPSAWKGVSRNVLNEVRTPHALKGQKLLAQGNALGNDGRKPVAL
mgnify:CR=1 FL=1